MATDVDENVPECLGPLQPHPLLSAVRLWRWGTGINTAAIFLSLSLGLALLALDADSAWTGLGIGLAALVTSGLGVFVVGLFRAHHLERHARLRRRVAGVAAGLAGAATLLFVALVALAMVGAWPEERILWLSWGTLVSLLLALIAHVGHVHLVVSAVGEVRGLLWQVAFVLLGGVLLLQVLAGIGTLLDNEHHQLETMTALAALGLSFLFPLIFVGHCRLRHTLLLVPVSFARPTDPQVGEKSSV